jgi:hypothetical protein
VGVDDDGVVLLDVDQTRGADELHFWFFEKGFI